MATAIDYTDENIGLFIERFNTGRWATQGELNIAKAQTNYNPSPEVCDLSPEIVKRHLDGDITLASYVIQRNNTCKFLVLDFDIRSEEAKPAIQDPANPKAKLVKENAMAKLREKVSEALTGLSNHLRIHSDQYLIEYSGSKGYHIWIFFENPVSSVKVYQMANVIKKELDLYDIETFPKQRELERESSGSAIKLPLGINRKTRNRCLFLGQDFNNDTRGQWQALLETSFVSEEQIDDILRLSDTVANKIEAGGCGHEATRSYGGSLDRMISRCAALQSAKEMVENANPDDGCINLPNSMRVAVANLFMQFEDGRPMVHKWLSKCDNYNEEITDKQLDGLAEKHAITCEKMISQGLCPGRCEAIEKAGGFSPFKLAFGGKMKDDKLHILQNLGQIENPIFCGKRIQVEFQVSSLIGTPYFSTRSITFDECDEGSCPKFEKCDCSIKSCKKKIDLPTSDDIHIEVFGYDNIRTMSTIKSRVKGCSQSKFLYSAGSSSRILVQPFLCSNLVNTIAQDETEKKFQAEDCTKESLSSAKEYKDYLAFFTDNTLETSKTYVGEGTVMPNPKSQGVTILFDKAEPKYGQIDGFALTGQSAAPGALDNFNQWKETSVKDKIDDFRNNICMIYGRDEVIMAMMLVMFSPLELTFNSAHQKGWVEAIFMGDSGQAKSKIVERITTYAGVGAIIGQNCSVAGLIGGNEQYKDQRFISWGLMPRNNKGLIFLDELQEFRVDVISALRTVRSTGIASINKMKGGQHEAKCRLVCAANPKDKKNMAEFKYGAESLTGIMNAADIRRFDLACFLSEDDIKEDVINRKSTATLPKISRQTFQTAILWAWSRKEEDIIISEEVTIAILEASSRLSKEFNVDLVPLCNTADMREKVVRLVCALAAFSGETPDNVKLVPSVEDVTVIEGFLNEIYRKDSVALDKLAAARRRETTIDDEQVEYLWEKINSKDSEGRMRYIKIPIILQSLQKSACRSADITNVSGASPADTTLSMMELLNLNLVENIGGSYTATPKLSKMIKRIEAKKQSGMILDADMSMGQEEPAL